MRPSKNGASDEQAAEPSSPGARAETHHLQNLQFRNCRIRHLRNGIRRPADSLRTCWFRGRSSRCGRSTRRSRRCRVRSRAPVRRCCPSDRRLRSGRPGHRYPACTFRSGWSLGAPDRWAAARRSAASAYTPKSSRCTTVLWPGRARRASKPPAADRRPSCCKHPSGRPFQRSSRCTDHHRSHSHTVRRCRRSPNGRPGWRCSGCRGRTHWRSRKRCHLYRRHRPGTPAQRRAPGRLRRASFPGVPDRPASQHRWRAAACTCGSTLHTSCPQRSPHRDCSHRLAGSCRRRCTTSIDIPTHRLPWCRDRRRSHSHSSSQDRRLPIGRSCPRWPSCMDRRHWQSRTCYRPGRRSQSDR